MNSIKLREQQQKKLTGNFFAFFFRVLVVLRLNSTCHQEVSVLVSGYFLSDIEVAFPSR